jgi:hypothetical protein
MGIVLKGMSILLMIVGVIKWSYLTLAMGIALWVWYEHHKAKYTRLDNQCTSEVIYLSDRKAGGQ